MKKTIITVVGKDTVGIIAKVCTYLANNRINIQKGAFSALFYNGDGVYHAVSCCRRTL